MKDGRFPQHTAAEQRAIEKHLKAAFEATVLLVEEMAGSDLRFLAVIAYENLSQLTTRLSLKAQPKPTSVKTY